MNKLPEHVSFEELNDLVDGLLDRRATDRVQAHLVKCDACASEHERLTAVLSASKDLPRTVLPQDDLWPELKQSLNSRKTLVLPGSISAGSTGARQEKRGFSWRTGALLAAAAVILVVLSSGITAIVLRRSSDIAIVPEAPQAVLPNRTPDASNTLPVSFRQTETEYNRTIDELKLAVDTQRSRLSPETVRTVDRSLTVVDSAIAEARAALLADPNNRMLVDLLAASYQRKLDLLRRTSELGSRI
jgi:Putative zinc-finger